MSENLGTTPRPLAELRHLLHDARATGDADRVHAALIEVLDDLLGHAEKQAKLLENLQSDLGHKQGIVTRIGGGDFASQQDNRKP